MKESPGRGLGDVRLTYAALDALKREYSFKRFHLVGQSGGGHTVAGLVQLRSDIGCAAIASGATSLRSMASDRVGRPIVGEHRFYDPIDHVHAMKQRPDLRLFVVSDRKDKFVSYRSQLEFVERVKARNLPITHEIATAPDKNSHGLFAYGHRLAVDCANESRDQVVVKGSDQVPALLRSQPPIPRQLAPPQTPADIINARGIWDAVPSQATPAQVAAVNARKAVNSADPPSTASYPLVARPPNVTWSNRIPVSMM